MIQGGMGYSEATSNFPQLELECWGVSEGMEGGEDGRWGVAGSRRERVGPDYQAIFMLC